MTEHEQKLRDDRNFSGLDAYRWGFRHGSEGQERQVFSPTYHYEAGYRDGLAARAAHDDIAEECSRG